MKNIEEIRAFQKATWFFWGGSETIAPPCLLCWAPGMCLHEIEPRSTYPEWWKDTLNSVVLCDECHKKAHAEGIMMREKLHEFAQKRAAQLHEDYIDWEDVNPVRVSKGARPKHVVDGKSIFTIEREIGKRAKKK